MANMKQLYEDKEKTIEAYPRVWLPVGSLYWNENDISDDIDKYFVGTWQRIEDVFILAAGSTYTAKSSGGSATHKHETGIGSMNDGFLTFNMAYLNSGKVGANQWGGRLTPTNAIGIQGYDIKSSYTSTNDNMPPYYVAYCWKRIS